MKKRPIIFQYVNTNQRLRLEKLSQLESALGYTFQNSDLLIEAITHSSAAREINHKMALDTEKVPWNERLEFLGDSVLGLAISDELMSREEEYEEGELSKIRAYLVCAGSLADIADRIQLGDFLILSQGETRAGGAKKRSVLADAVEACFGAIYIDGGFDQAKSAILTLFSHKLECDLTQILEKDYKTRLQEVTQRLFKETPVYELIEKKGPDHKALFQIAIHITGQPVVRGVGCSKKRASQDAARKALKNLLESAKETGEP